MDAARDAINETILEGGRSAFSILDYCLFLGILAVSGFIGIYYGFISKRKQDNPEEYILGNKEMNIFPVAASLIVSHIAGVTMLALPADIYANGSQYAMSVISIFIVGCALVYLYIPVFYDLGYTSCFTYLEERFDKSVRVAASLVFTLDCLLMAPVLMYVPALAFNQVTGFNVHLVTASASVLCVFYTTVGGLRGVVWTDAIQFVTVIGGILIVIFIGTASEGGIVKVLEANVRGGRLMLFNMDPNPLEKSTFWTMTIGLTTLWLSQKCASQGTMQRFMSLPTRTQANRCIWIFCAGVALIKLGSCYVGLLLYAHYEKCDPIASGKIKKLDQVLLHYAMDLFESMPGLTGLFISGIFAAGLSTMSSLLNSLAGTIYEDMIKPCAPNLSDRAASNVMKAIVVVTGALVLGMVFVVEQTKAILHLSYSLAGVTAGTMIGIFNLGMLSPKFNTKGIISGAVSAFGVVGTILIGAQLSTKPPHLPFRTDECEGPIAHRNGTAVWLQEKHTYEEVPWPFRISFMYYSLIGATVVTIVAYIVSLATGGPEQEIDEKLLAPFVRTKKSLNEKVLYQVVQNIVPGVNK